MGRALRFRVVDSRDPARIAPVRPGGRQIEWITDEDCARYQALIAARLTPAHADWVEHGRLVAGDPKTLD